MRVLAFSVCAFVLGAGYGCSCDAPAVGEGEGEGAGEGEGEGEGEGSGDQTPTVTITSPADNSQFAQGQSILFTCDANDPEDGALTGTAVTWSSDIDGAIGVGNTVQNALVSAGSHTVTCSATDSAGNVGSASITVGVLANFIPVVTITSPPDGSFFLPSDTIAFTGAATDTEDGTLTGASLVWTSDNGNALGIGATVSTALALGDHTVVLTATDSAGASASQTITLHVVSNLPPACVIAQPADGLTVLEGTSVAFSATCVDADGTGAIPNGSYTWTSDLQGALGVGANVTQGLVTLGAQVISVCAVDTVDPAVVGCASIVVNVEANQPPVVTINAPANSASFNACDAPIALSCSAADPNVGQAVTFRWLDNGTQISLARNTNFDPTTTGQHVLTCEATDSLGALGTATTTITVTSPGAVINNPAAGDVLNAGQNIRFSGNGCSLTAGNLTGAQLVWSSNVDGQFGTGNTVNTSALTNGAHIISLTANDGVGVAVDSIAIIVNNPPVVTITAPLNDSVSAAGTGVSLNATVTDVEDGNTLSATWVDSANGTIGTGNSLVATGLLIGKHTVTATATDSAGVSANDTASFFVTNGGAPASSLFVSTNLNAQVSSLLFDAASNTLWAATNGSGVLDVALDLGSAAGFAGSTVGSTVVNTVAIYTDGTLMAGTNNGLAFGCDPTTLLGCQLFQAGDLALQSDNVRAIAVLPDGRTVVGTNQCLMFSDWNSNTHTSICEQQGGGDGLSNSQILDVAFDPISGGVWVVTQGGVDLMAVPVAPDVSRNNTSFTRIDNLNQARVVTVAPSGDAWFGGNNGVTLRDAAGTNTNFRDNNGLPSNTVRDIAIDVLSIGGLSHEIAWVATSGGLGRIDAAVPSVVGITTQDGLPTNDCRAVQVLADHSKVVGTANGVFGYFGQ